MLAVTVVVATEEMELAMIQQQRLALMIVINSTRSDLVSVNPSQQHHQNREAACFFLVVLKLLANAIC